MIGSKVVAGDVYQHVTSHGVEKVIVTRSKKNMNLNSSFVQVMYETGDTGSIHPIIFLQNWHNIGHIDKFAECLNELHQLAKLA